tara:strand:- start:533 stop:739 length:207 start_codon:yes stop_codon:yes gene_type:complete
MKLMTDMKLDYTVIDDSGNERQSDSIVIGNLYDFPENQRERKAKGCAARKECVSLYSVRVDSLTDHQD